MSSLINNMSTVFSSKSSALVAVALLLGLSSGCASFKLKDPPVGFIEVSSSKWDGDAELRMKAPDNVGLNVTSFDNSRGGTLPLWATDMVKKLAGRGYTLEQQTPVKSANGVEGTRFDFSYTPRGTEGATEKFYTAVLFVTDDWQVVVQMAGDEALEADHASDVEKILSEIKIGGCKIGSKVCKAGQPSNLMSPAKPNPTPDASAEPKPQPDPAPIEPAA